MEHAKHLSTLLNELEARGLDGEFNQALSKHRTAAERGLRRRAEREVLRKHGLQCVGDD